MRNILFLNLTAELRFIISLHLYYLLFVSLAIRTPPSTMGDVIWRWTLLTDACGYGVTRRTPGGLLVLLVVWLARKFVIVNAAENVFKNEILAGHRFLVK
ncbi:hypothetical protein CDL12_26768 [Handroanthus impetiginosus]|uniref:Uncharacterized protein n=1 Tax=Handroanthus impetiginosus TaxID=429701 RepID=A0A2G9G722_9LAMI|nr:hypothetical protein CDL12_26768 [Handroanthus impetiginosus]